MAVAGQPVRMLALVLGLLALAQQSMQLSLGRVGGGPYVGLLLGSTSNERALLESRVFVPSSSNPYIDVAGRRFHIGTIHNVDAVYVLSRTPTVNAAITAQLLLDSFPIRGLVIVGSSGSVNNSLNIGSVSAPKQVGFTSIWNWEPFRSGKEQLKFGAFNTPTAGENFLQGADINAISLYTPEDKRTIFWLPVNTSWYNLATDLKGLKLENCLDKSCLADKPQILFGKRGSTADIYVSNVAYREYVYRKFKVSTVDEDSAAIVLAALSGAKPFVVFRGISNTAGRPSADSKLSYLGSVNVIKVAAQFFKLLKSADEMAAPTY